MKILKLDLQIIIFNALARKESRTMINKIYLIVLFTISLMLCSCQFNTQGTVNDVYKITDINIYKSTPVWDLALAVKNEDTHSIEKILKNDPLQVNYIDPKYGATLLLWSVGMEKFKSAETLLKLGADPNIEATNNYGQTPLIIAAGYSWIDNDAKKDPKYVKLLLAYGANPNKTYMGSNVQGNKSIIEIGSSPLMISITCGLEKTKALVEAGANINYKTKSSYTPSIKALERGGINATLESKKYAYYLIVEKHAKVTEPHYRPENVTMPGDNPNDKFYPVDLLRDWISKLDSEEYSLKMEIVKEFARQGVNYWDTKVPTDRLSQIQKIYPDNWKEYIKRY